MKPDAGKKRFEIIERNFLPSAEVPLLRNGENLTTSFGAFTPTDPNGPWLDYGAETEITVVYHDVSGRRFEAKQPLKVYARQGFGGGIWDEVEKP